MSHTPYLQAITRFCRYKGMKKRPFVCSYTKMSVYCLYLLFRWFTFYRSLVLHVPKHLSLNSSCRSSNSRHSSVLHSTP